VTPTRRGILLCGLFGLCYFWISPPLFNYDGYSYRLQGLAPLQNINQTHLIWVPFQWIVWQLSYLFHSSSTRFFQSISTIILVFVYIRSFQLWERISGSASVAAALTLFVACAPPIWYLGSQNEPYPLLFLCVISSLSLIGEGRGEAKAVFWLSLATLLHQAALLLCIGFAIARLLTGKEPLRSRCRRAFLWLAAVGFFVGSSYSLVAFLKGIPSLPAFWNWLLGYLHTQHHVQGCWYESLAKSMVGLAYAVLPLQAQEDRLYAHFNDAQIRAGLITLCGVLVLSALALSIWPRFRRWIRALPWRDESVLGVSIALMVSWAFFAIFWEPTNYYWAVILFPALTLAARAFRAPSSWHAPILGLLISISVWNLSGDLQQDALNAQRFPDPQLQSIRARISKNDLLLFLKQSWHDGVDYDLLGRCLTLEGYHVEYVLDHYVIRQPAHWQDKLNARFTRSGRMHQSIFVSQWILRRDLYKDLANAYFLSSYVMEKYRPIAGPPLFVEVNAFFKTYKRTDSGLNLRDDTFVIVNPGSGK